MCSEDKKNTFTYLKRSRKNSNHTKCKAVCYRKLENQKCQISLFFSIKLKSSQSSKTELGQSPVPVNALDSSCPLKSTGTQGFFRV